MFINSYDRTQSSKIQLPSNSIYNKFTHQNVSNLNIKYEKEKDLTFNYGHEYYKILQEERFLFRIILKL